MTKVQTFHQIHRLNPLEKMSFFMVFKTDVFVVQKDFFATLKRRKSFYHYLFSRSMTLEYRELQGVAEGYKGLQGVTRGYKGL